MPRIAVSYCIHDDYAYLAQSLASVREAGEMFVFVSRVPWHGEPGDWETSAQIARDSGAEVVLGDWSDELTHRTAAYECLRQRDYTHALVIDGDEIVEPALLQTLLTIAQNELADRVYIHWDTYWKSPDVVIRPRERFTPLYLFDLRHARYVRIREFEGGRALLLPPEYGLVHHLSYVGPDERIYRKITTWGHRTEVVPGWWEHVWLKWDSDKQLTYLDDASDTEPMSRRKIHLLSHCPRHTIYRNAIYGKQNEKIRPHAILCHWHKIAWGQPVTTSCVGTVCPMPDA